MVPSGPSDLTFTQRGAKPRVYEWEEMGWMGWDGMGDKSG